MRILRVLLLGLAVLTLVGCSGEIGQTPSGESAATGGVASGGTGAGAGQGSGATSTTGGDTNPSGGTAMGCDNPPCTNVIDPCLEPGACDPIGEQGVEPSNVTRFVRLTHTTPARK